jgi:hypothetical protein
MAERPSAVYTPEGSFLCGGLAVLYRLLTPAAFSACAAVLFLPPAAAGEPKEEAIRAAIAKSLPLLKKGAAGHIDQKTCFACHNQALPMLALTSARERGFEVSDEDLKKQAEFIATFLGKNRENYLKGRGTGGQVDTAGYALWTLATSGWKPDDTTAAVAEYLLQYNKDVDHWKTTSNRPPSEASAFATTYVAIRGLQSYATAEQKERVQKRLEEVRDWLRKAAPKDTEDRVFRLWSMKLAGVDEKELQSAINELVQAQRPDGGWSQLNSLESDAYASGSALVALHQAAGLKTSDEVYRNGLKFLVQAQLEDGSWLVKSRSRPFQPYYESGFPHGKDQFISIAASGWATTALVLACPKK